MSFGLMPFDFFQNAMYLAMLEEAESGNAGTQPVKEYSSNRPKKSECFASAFLFSDFFGMFPCLKKSRGSGQSPVFITAINFVIFEKLLSRDFTSLTFVSLIISIQADFSNPDPAYFQKIIILLRLCLIRIPFVIPLRLDPRQYRIKFPRFQLDFTLR